MRKILLTMILLLTCTWLYLFFYHREISGYYQIKSDYMIAYMKYKWIDHELYSYIDYYSTKYFLHPLFVCAVIQKESKGEKDRRGKDGEYGYLQVLPIHFIKRGISHRLRFEPDYNLDVGCGYLAGAFIKAKDNLVHTARLYNQGHYGKVQRYKNWGYTKDIYLDYMDSLRRKEIKYTSIL